MSSGPAPVKRPLRDATRALLTATLLLGVAWQPALASWWPFKPHRPPVYESQPHNVAVYSEADGGGDEIVIGDIITGPDVTTQVVVPALEPGTYYFRCDVHPEMEGTIVVEG